MADKQAVFCSPVRTAIGTYGASLKGTPTTELGATVIRGTVERSGLDPSHVQAVVMGQLVQAGARMNPSRQAAIGADIPVNVPAMVRLCSAASAISRSPSRSTTYIFRS